MTATPPLHEHPPRWFWWLPLLAIVLWWPLGPFWASDDFFALHYARDGANALADFTGWQYGARDLWFFWRPLITASFWFDALVGGGDPFWSHLSNVLAHGASTLLLGLLWRRLLDDRRAFAAASLWAIAPGHAGTIAWAVGRVDGHTTVWILLALLLFVRFCEGRDRTRAWSVLAALLALASKELAFAIAPLCTLLAFALRRAPTASPLATARAALRASWPHWALLAAVLAFRVFGLGRFGGYSGTVLQPWPMAQGFVRYALDLLDPLRWAPFATMVALTAFALTALAWLGAIPTLLATWHCLPPRRWPATLLALALFAVAAAPVAGFFGSADNHHNLRYFYLAFGALAGLLVAGPAWTIAVAFAVFAPAFVVARQEQWRADGESAAMHRELVQQTEGRDGPCFVAGLPHGNAAGTVVQLHFGIDRMLLPPFAERQVQLYAHRPLLEATGALRLEDDDGPIAPALGSTFWFRGAGLLVAVPPRRAPDLPLQIEARADSSATWQPANAIQLPSPRLQQLKDRQVQLRVRTPGVRPQLYRVTIFTATGYLCTAVPDHAAADATDGEIDLLRFFGGDRAAGIEPARVDAANVVLGGTPDSAVLYLLQVPTIVDLQPSFPVLIEAGHVEHDARGDRFVVDRAARVLPQLELDRDYARQVRRMDGRER